MPELPRHGVDLEDDVSLYLVEDKAERYATQLGLNNDARVLVDEDGAHLNESALLT
jgi:hypothetical protein